MWVPGMTREVGGGTVGVRGEDRWVEEEEERREEWAEEEGELMEEEEAEDRRA